MDKQRRNIANIIFFVRGVEPRVHHLDLLGTFEKQLDLVDKYGFKSSFLLQYDAMIDEKYTSMIKRKLDDGCEIGGWFEIVQPLVEKAGLTWRGRYSWDWHSDVGFSVGYTPEERKLLVDVFMEEFKTCFGYYPRSIGSWMIDAVTLAYMSDRYGIEASCNCRDQWGTDGYTLWGGYYGQGYFPSRKNVLCPAQTAEAQIPVPVFRMLGSDPIYQYDIGLADRGIISPSECQQVVTLEPIYGEDGGGGGGDPEWVDWYFRENFAPGVSFNYTQVGQENSFGWERMKHGLEYQFAEMKKRCERGELCVETLLETGRWFKERFTKTPSASISAMSDWKNKGRKSLWYENRFYRVNLYEDAGRTWIRDIHKFDEKYEERYLDTPCDNPLMIYDNLPVIDGNRWSGGGIRAGMYPAICDHDGKIIELKGAMTVEYPEDGSMAVKISGDRALDVTCDEGGISFSLTSGTNERLVLDICDGSGMLAKVELGNDIIQYKHNGFSYHIKVDNATEISKITNGIRIISWNKELKITV